MCRHVIFSSFLLGPLSLVSLRLQYCLLRVIQQRLRIHHHAVLDRVLDRCHLRHLTVGQLPRRAGSIHHFYVVQRILRQHHQVREVARPDRPQFVVAERKRANLGPRVERLERAEAGVLKQRQFADGRKAPQVVLRADI